MSFPKVAVVIVHWNRKALLEQFLPFVVASTYPNLQIVVADNHSDDGSQEFIRSHYPQISIVQNDSNYGYAGGYNQALPQIDADYYILLNNDIEVTPEWIEPVIAEMEKHPTVAACQPKMLDFKTRNRFEYAGACGGYFDRLGYIFCRGRIFEAVEKDEGQYDSTESIFWATGACLFIRAELFHEAGGFDANFFAHMEEVDLCWRLQQMGYTIKAVPASKVYHVGGGTLSKMSPQKTYLNFRNNLIMLTKNLPVPTLLWLIPLRSFLDLISSIFFLLNGFPRYSWAVHRAHADYFFKFGKWWRLRNHVRYLYRNKSFHGVYNGSIVAKHFILGFNHFNDIKIEDHFMLDRMDNMIHKFLLRLKLTNPLQDPNREVELFNFSETMPEFPGGPEALSLFIRQQTRYPKAALANGIKGKVVLEFTISKRGRIKMVKVIESVHPLLDKEARRIVQSMPRWIPGKQNEKSVVVKCTIPITFSLS
jgi:hypothetical protein